MEVLTCEEQYIRDIPAVLGKLAGAHVEADAHNGVMVLLDYNPDDPGLPGQDPTSFLADGYHPQTRGLTDKAAEVAQPRFMPVRYGLAASDGAAEKIEATGEHLAAGRNVVVVTRHDNLTDIAYALKMTSDLLYDQGYEPQAQAIVVSKMLSRIGHLFEIDGITRQVPAIATLQLLCSQIYMSYPRTESTKAEIDKLPNAATIWSEVGRHNKQMSEALQQQLDQGGVLLAMAPTGTTRVTKTETGAVELAPLNDGTIEIMRHPATSILSMLVDYESEIPFARFIGGLAPVKDANGAKAVLDRLASPRVAAEIEESLVAAERLMLAADYAALKMSQNPTWKYGYSEAARFAKELTGPLSDEEWRSVKSLIESHPSVRPSQTGSLSFNRKKPFSPRTEGFMENQTVQDLINAGPAMTEEEISLALKRIEGSQEFHRMKREANSHVGRRHSSKKK